MVTNVEYHHDAATIYNDHLVTDRNNNFVDINIDADENETVTV